MTRSARLEVRIAPEDKALLEAAAELSRQSLSSFVTRVAVERARELLNGPQKVRVTASRPIGGWTFELPDDWDAPLDDFAEYR